MAKPNDLFDRLLPGEKPSYDDLVEVVRSLAASREVKLEDLPLASLKSNLEQTWQPEVTALLQPASIGPELLKPPEAPRYVGTTGQPAFQGTWTNYDAAPGPAGRALFFYKERGRVYIEGVIRSGASGSVVFTLPAGYLPVEQTNDSINILTSCAGGIAVLGVRVNGEVYVSNNAAVVGSNVSTFCFLSGVNFRAAG